MASLVWSEIPGCFEQCLQRIYFNPLVDESKKLNQALVSLAHQIDLHELNVLQDKIDRFFNSFPDDCDDVNLLLSQQRTEVETLIQKCYEYGGKALSYVEILTKNRKSAISAWTVYSSNDNETLNNIEEYEFYYNTVLSKYNHAFIRQMEREVN
jgi:hypothetical protein